MTHHPHLEAIYSRRFAGKDAQRNQVWQVLTRHYFQRWIKPADAVLDLGAGFREFINNIQAARKYALDLNPVTPLKAASDVVVVSEDVTKPWSAASESVNVVFSSNFFEHLPTKQDFKHCLSEIYRVLCSQGLLIALGPNIRFGYDVYWDFFDHYLPLSDRSVVEAAELAGLCTELVVPRFLPFTMQGKLPSWRALVRLYLSFPLAQRILGKQFLVVMRKP